MSFICMCEFQDSYLFVYQPNRKVVISILIYPNKRRLTETWITQHGCLLSRPFGISLFWKWCFVIMSMTQKSMGQILDQIHQLFN